ncbi:DDE-type integrase/transposase/recombinase [Myxococcota bacterium]|nr:DDE-type integrase/transposase/recombinase [Myxococcota bacterium]
MPTDLALLRFQIVSAYLALEPARGDRGPLLRQLASRPWPGPDGTLLHFAPETIRGWVRRFRKGGLPALEDAARPRRGEVALPPETIEILAALKRQVPERTLDMLIHIAEDTGQVPQGLVRRSTLHRALARRGLSGQPKTRRSTEDLDRYEAPAPNHTWQSDAKAGPWLPDPERGGKLRQAWIFAFLDDHSRLILASRWSFKQDQPTMELVLRRALQRCGKPGRIYTDNGSVYRARHMARICSSLDIVPVFCTEDRPEGKGKIERYWKTAVNPFSAEVKASSIRTIDELNEAWKPWLHRHYHDVIHGETGMKPPDRWLVGIETRQWVDEEKLYQAFRWEEQRTPDKTGWFSLFGVHYQVSSAPVRGKVKVRFDPEDLREIEVLDAEGRLIERLQPMTVTEHRRPRVLPPVPEGEVATVDYLAHFGLSKLPFRKNVSSADMFQSRAQLTLLHGLGYFLDIRSIALITGPSGVGKSITLRRFVQELDEDRFHPVHLPIAPTTPIGFLRTLNRALGLPMRAHAADLFAQAQQHLCADQGPHPLLVLDDAEGCKPELLDLLRRLTAHGLDGEDRFSILVSGTDDLLLTLRAPGLEPLRSRVSYAQVLRPFQVEDAHAYVTWQLQKAEAHKSLFSDEAVRILFQASGGRPRRINQLALQALVAAAVHGREHVDARFLSDTLADHPLFDHGSAA